MTWEWSHTQEAYDYARGRLGGLPLDVLQVIWAEWQARVEDGSFDQRLYQLKLYAVRHPSRSHLYTREWFVERIWEEAEQQRYCTDGGWEAWVCPFGCHLVPFSPPKEEPQLTDWRDFDER